VAKTVAIVQSCYVPWKGYFDLINSVDEFVLYDDRQFTRRDWRNRNRIKTAQGTRWLTIPVETKGRYHQRIDETVVSDERWPELHWKTLSHSYGAAPYYAEHREWLQQLYRTAVQRRLSAVNRHFIEGICALLGIETTLSWSTDYDVEGTRTDRLVALCQAAGATEYLSGPRARTYLDEEQFAEAGIRLTYFDYGGYPEYAQLHPPFDHAVSIIDLLVSTGPDARRYLKSFADALTPLGA
jgi:WbqC-like protein family